MIQVKVPLSIAQECRYVLQFLEEQYLTVNWEILPTEESNNITFLENGVTLWTSSVSLLKQLGSHWLEPLPSLSPISYGSLPCLGFSDPDPLGTVFFLLSGYSEALQSSRDAHDRIYTPDSFVFKNKWNERCIVDELADQLTQEWVKLSPNFKARDRKFHYRMSHDVDRPYKFAYTPWFTSFKRALGSYRFGNPVRSILKELGLLILYPFQGDQIDPFNRFDFILEQHQKWEASPVFYWTLPQENQEFDCYYFWSEGRIQRLISVAHANGARQGLHPRYSSSETEDGLKQEWEYGRIEAIQNQLPLLPINRQHFLRFQPLTFPAQLEKAKVKEDSSIAFADNIGFRYSTCSAFKLYDLINRKTTSVVEIPLCAMDVSIINQRYLNITDSKTVAEVLKNLMNTVVRHQGVYCLLWHNDTLQHVGYRKVYRQILESAASHGSCL